MSEIALFVHSTGTGPFMWKPFLADTPEYITALTPTNRGYSPTDLLARGTPFCLADEVAHLIAQIPEGTTGLHLVAHSYGGLVALALAQAVKLPVRSIWLYEPVLFAPLRAAQASLSPAVEADVALLFEDPRFLMDEATGGDAAWLERFVDYWNAPGTWASMTDKAKFMAQMVGWKMFQEVRMVATEAKAFEHYDLQVPLTLVHGEKTTAPAADMVRRLAQVNAHAHVEVLSGAGHMGVLQAPEAVRATLREHWSRLPSV